VERKELQELLNNIITGIDDFRSQIEALKTGCQSKVVQPVIDTLDKIETLLLNIQYKLVEFRDELVASISPDKFDGCLAGHHDWISIAITILMLWMILAQRP